MLRRVKPINSFLTMFSVLAAPLGGAAAAEGQGALNALNMNYSRPRSQPPSQDYQGLEKEGLIPEDAALSAELGAAPCVTPLPAGRFFIQRSLCSGAAGQGQRRLRRG
jgi:hypothetical protein